jgi:hypothetical protein
VECHAAARSLFRKGVHLGPRHASAEAWACRDGLSDDGVAALWSSCEWIAALRRVEGFELPALEGLLCGARPVAFDREHYRHWLGEHAEYVPEGTAPEVTAALLELFGRKPRPVRAAERDAVVARFAWPALAAAFWERAL